MLRLGKGVLTSREAEEEKEGKNVRGQRKKSEMRKRDEGKKKTGGDISEESLFTV